MKKFIAPLLAIILIAFYGWQNSINTPSETDISHWGADNVFMAFFVSGLISVMLMGIPIVIGLMVGGKARLRRWCSWSHVPSLGKLIIIFLFLVLACEGIMGAFAPEADQANVQFIAMLSPLKRLVLTLPVCILIPIAEECLFRGLILEALPKTLGLPVSALLFAVAHGVNLYCFALFFFGLVLGMVALRTRSLLPCILFHGLFNLLSLVFA